MRLLVLLPVLLLANCREESTRSGAASSGTGARPAAVKRMGLADMEDLFKHTAESTDWDMKGELLWGYFFTDAEKAPLEPLRDELVASGYRFVRLDHAEEDGADSPALWMLHVEKVEKHTAESLHARNQEFYGLVKRLGVDEYDGMDVGPVEEEVPGEQ